MSSHASISGLQAPPAPPGRTVLLYDGVCALCNFFVRFVLRQDRKSIFYFSPLQGDLARAILTRHGVDIASLDTVVLVSDLNTPHETLFFRSDAATEVLSRLGGGWALWGRLLRHLPRSFRDARYRLVARWRYRIFGRYAACPLPALKDRGRFLS